MSRFNKILKILFSPRAGRGATIAAFAAILFLISVFPAHAGVSDWLAEKTVAAVGTLVHGWVWIIGQLCLVLIYAILWLCNYNEFVTSSAVENGWVIIRDVVNMFFIVILLVIAFGTIFDIKGNYSYKKMLPRLLIMAVVINFSRTICGILIDFGQVVMLTFVNGFNAAAGGNFVKALKIEELLKFRTMGEAEKIDIKVVFASFILAAILITVTAVVLAAMAIMLVMRIVMLWFLVVLSPLAFLASVWPSGRINQKYGLWWDMFLDNIMVGPLLAFFLWLSLLVLGNGDIGTTGSPTFTGEGELEYKPSAGYTQVGTTDNMISYLLGIGMLLGSLAMTQGMRSAGSGIAGAALGKLKGYATAGVKGVAALPGRGAKRVAGAAYEKSGARAYKDAMVAKVQSSKFGKVVGLGTKEYKDAEAAKRSEVALRRLGMKDKADALMTKLETAEQKNIQDKGLTNEQLLQKYKSAKKAKDRVATGSLAREIANRDLIRNSSQFKEYAGGDKRLEFGLRSGSYKAGNKEAFWGYQEDATKPTNALKDAQDTYRREYTTPGQRQKLYTDIKSGARKDKDGKLNQEFALEKLSVLEKNDIDHRSFSPAVKEQIKDAFVLAKENDSEGFGRLKLEDKFNELFNSGPGAVSFATHVVANQPALLAEQERLRAGQAKGAQEAGILKKSDADKSAETALASGVSTFLNDDAWAKNMSERMGNILESVSKVETLPEAQTAQSELIRITAALEDIATRLDAAGRKTGQYDATGNEMSNLDLVRQGRMYQGVDSASKITDEMISDMTAAPGTTADKTKRTAAASAMGVSARDMNEAVLRQKGVFTAKETEPAYVKANTNYREAEAKGREMLGQAIKNTDAVKRAKEAKLALKKIGNGLRILEKNGELFPNVSDDVAAIQAEIKRLKEKGVEISQAEVDLLMESLENIRGGRLA